MNDPKIIEMNFFVIEQATDTLFEKSINDAIDNGYVPVYGTLSIYRSRYINLNGYLFRIVMQKSMHDKQITPYCRVIFGNAHEIANELNTRMPKGELTTPHFCHSGDLTLMLLQRMANDLQVVN